MVSLFKDRSWSRFWDWNCSFKRSSWILRSRHTFQRLLPFWLRWFFLILKALFKIKTVHLLWSWTHFFDDVAGVFQDHNEAFQDIGGLFICGTFSRSIVLFKLFGEAFLNFKGTFLWSRWQFLRPRKKSNLKFFIKNQDQAPISLFNINIVITLSRGLFMVSARFSK